MRGWLQRDEHDLNVAGRFGDHRGLFSQKIGKKPSTVLRRLGMTARGVRIRSRG